MRLPISALFRHGEGWAVFRLRDGRARLTPVQTGLRGGLWAEIIEGVSEGERVIVHPDLEIRDRDRVRARG